MLEDPLATRVRGFWHEYVGYAKSHAEPGRRRMLPLSFPEACDYTPLETYMVRWSTQVAACGLLLASPDSILPTTHYSQNTARSSGRDSVEPLLLRSSYPIAHAAPP